MSCYFCKPIATDGVREGGRAFRRRHFVAGVPLPARSAAAVIPPLGHFATEPTPAPSTAGPFRRGVQPEGVQG